MSSSLPWRMFFKILEKVVLRALEEDLQGGDLTTMATVDEDQLGAADAIAKQDLVVSGTEAFSRCFHAVHPACRVERLMADGHRASAGDVLLRVEGPTRALLMAERTALNFLQSLSGTATLTRAYVDAASGRVRIVDTRKTLPGLRALQRQAVLHGGGRNHRDSLGSAILIKENHISAAGGLKPAVERARNAAPHTSRIEVEVETLEQVDEALSARADIIMLDDFTDDQVTEAVARISGRALVEVSGGITIERVKALADIGVDVVSVGALTHSAPAADISLLIRPVGEGASPVPAAP